MKEIEKLILENIKTKADVLCSRKEESSIFYHKDYDSLVDLNFESILGELCENFPFFSQILQVMASKNENIPMKDLAPKFSFIYSILMCSRWNELSSFKRVMTILLIEGGCSKKVRYFKISYWEYTYNLFLDMTFTRFFSFGARQGVSSKINNF